MRTHFTHQLRLDFDSLPFDQPTTAGVQLRSLLVPLPVAASFVRRSEQMVAKARTGPHGLPHVRQRHRVLYSVGGLLDYCKRRGHTPDWSALRPVQRLDAGRGLRIAASVAAEHLRAAP